MTCPNFASSVVPECFLASPEYLGMNQGVLYGGSVISISVVRVRAVQKLYSDNMNRKWVNGARKGRKADGRPWLTRQSTTSMLPSRVASSGIHRI